MAQDDDLSLQTLARLEAAPDIPQQNVCEPRHGPQPWYDSVSAGKVPLIEFSEGTSQGMATAIKRQQHRSLQILWHPRKPLANIAAD
jgi:hypothetical protein